MATPHPADMTDEFSFLLAASSIEGAGIGVHAAHPIDAGVHLALLPEGFVSRRLAEDAIPEQFRIYCVAESGDVWRCPPAFNAMEIGWYLNHSATPNAERYAHGYRSTRPIAEGEEITMDYNTLDEPEDKRESFLTDTALQNTLLVDPL